jgi:murein DD-endopeptidase MepM/ murein hydrolase activator NlpD
MRPLNRILVLLLLLVPLSGMAQSHNNSSRHKPKKPVKSLKKDLGKVRQKKAAVRRELHQTRVEVREVRGDIQSVDKRLEFLEDKLVETGNRLKDSQAEQARLARNLKATTVRLAQTEQAVRKRLRTMYQRGDTTVLTAFVKSSDVGDLAARKFLLEQIAKEDRRVFEGYIALRNEVASDKRRQDTVVVRVRQLRQQQKERQNELEDVRHEKGVYLGQLKEKESDLEALLAQFERDEAQIESQIRAYLATQSRPGSKPLPPFKGGFGRPVNGPITSGFGMRYHPILHRTKLHTGIDFGVGMGTPIRAAASGVVIGATYLKGYGNPVILDHGSGLSTVYAHCSRVYVRAGAKISRGQTIGAVGSTGYSTGPHLHFEVRVNGRPVNPLGRL